MHPSASSSTSIGGCSRSSRVIGTPRSPRLPAPGPARLGQRRLGIGDVHAPDAILPEGQGEPGELPVEPGAARRLGREQRELLTGRRRRAVQLEDQPGDRGRRRGPLEAGEQQALDRLGLGGRLGEALLDVQLGGRPREGEGQVQVQVEPRPRGRQPARDELAGQRRGEPMEDEAERLEILGRRARGAGRAGAVPAPGAAGTARAPRRAPGRGSGRPPRRTGRPAPTGRARRPGRSGAGRSGSSRARTSGSAVSSPDGCGARKAASPPGGTRFGAPGRARTAATVALKRVPAMPARMCPAAPSPASPRRRPAPARAPRPAARRGPARDPTAARGRRPGPRTARTPHRADRRCRRSPG